MQLNNALAAWKKAKPLTLTKTGISEVLRTLPANPAVVVDFKKEIPVLENVKKTVEVALANKHVQQHKGAVDCLKEIHKAVDEKLKHDRELRGKLNASLKKIFDAGHAFLKAPNPQVAAQIKNFVHEYDGYLSTFKPTNADYFQIPPRVELLASSYAKAILKKDQKEIEGVKAEMTKYMQSHPMMAV